MFGWFRRRQKRTPSSESDFDIAASTGNHFIVGESASAEAAASRRFSPSPPSLRRLTRVVPVGQTAAFDSGELTISSVEVFEDGAVIRYYFQGSPEARKAEEEFFTKSDEKAIQERIERRGNWLRRYAEQDIEVTDDLQTPYTVHPRGGGGGTLQWEGGFSVSPAIPGSARQLRLTIVKLDFPWDTPGQIASVSSPATFTIDF